VRIGAPIYPVVGTGHTATLALEEVLPVAAPPAPSLRLADSLHSSTLQGSLQGLRLLGRYRVDQPIGRGGMGIVYRAHDERLGRDVAIKVLTGAAADPAARVELRATLAREARTAAGVRHPNVISVFDHATDPRLGLDFLVMELLEGEDLAARVRRQGLPRPETALRLLREAAAGLAAGHRAGLVHRDVKPANLFLEGSDGPGGFRLRVLDFGVAAPSALARSEGEAALESSAGPPSGLSPAYASPEQLLGLSHVGPASDVFSLGAVAFHLLTGRRPFRSSDPEVAGAELTESLALLQRDSLLPEPVARILERALLPDPAARFADAGELLHALDDVDAGASPDGRRAAAGAGAAAGPTMAADGDAARGLLPSPDGTADPFEAPPWPPHPLGMAPPPGARTARQAAGSEGQLRRLLHAALTSGLAMLLGLTWLTAVAAAPSSPWAATLALLLSAFLTPLAFHRAGGERGSLRFSTFASLAGTALAYLLSAEGGSALGVAISIVGAQAVMTATALWLSGPPAEEAGPPAVASRAEWVW
jgi:hypothetical protein